MFQFYQQFININKHPFTILVQFWSDLANFGPILARWCSSQGNIEKNYPKDFKDIQIWAGFLDILSKEGLSLKICHLSRKIFIGFEEFWIFLKFKKFSSQNLFFFIWKNIGRIWGILDFSSNFLPVKGNLLYQNQNPTKDMKSGPYGSRWKMRLIF